MTCSWSDAALTRPKSWMLLLCKKCTGLLATPCWRFCLVFAPICERNVKTNFGIMLLTRVNCKTSVGKLFVLDVRAEVNWEMSDSWAERAYFLVVLIEKLELEIYLLSRIVRRTNDDVLELTLLTFPSFFSFFNYSKRSSGFSCVPIVSIMANDTSFREPVYVLLVLGFII